MNLYTRNKLRRGNRYQYHYDDFSIFLRNIPVQNLFRNQKQNNNNVQSNVDLPRRAFWSSKLVRLTPLYTGIPAAAGN
jgi:hypothetical protein